MTVLHGMLERTTRPPEEGGRHDAVLDSYVAEALEQANEAVLDQSLELGGGAVARRHEAGEVAGLAEISRLFAVERSRAVDPVLQVQHVARRRLAQAHDAVRALEERVCRIGVRAPALEAVPSTSHGRRTTGGRGGVRAVGGAPSEVRTIVGQRGLEVGEDGGAIGVCVEAALAQEERTSFLLVDSVELLDQHRDLVLLQQ